MYRHLDLFAGIGGFSLAASWTGVVAPAGFCEIDPWCRRVLAKHWPGVPQHDDIKTLTGDALGRFGRIDLVTGGFPCQPFSVAGLRRGKDDDRYLWPEMARVIDETRPTYILVENSPNIRSMVLDDMFDDLEGIGYTVRACVVPAAAVGALHRRDRMWTLAYIDRPRKPQPTGHVARERMGIGGAPATAPNADGCGRGSRQCDVQAWQPGSPNDLVETPTDPDREQCEKQRGTIPAQEEHVAARRHLEWPTRPGLLRRIHGVPHRVDRVRGLGNAIVPQIAYEILRVMLGNECQVAR